MAGDEMDWNGTGPGIQILRSGGSLRGIAFRPPLPPVGIRLWSHLVSVGGRSVTNEIDILFLKELRARNL